MNVLNVPTSDLRPAKYNPRSWSKKATSDLKDSIEKFGLVDPIICNSAPNRKNIVIGGHFRLHVAKLLGYKEIPVVYINISDIEKEKELNLRLNKNTGDWDFDVLKDFNLDVLLDVGFDSKSLSSIWDDLLGVESDDFNLNKEIDKITTPTVKTGNLYQLSNHRLVCGDSTDLDVVKKLVGDDQVNILYCDPPFNISLDYDKGFGKKSKYGGKVNDSKPDVEYDRLITETLKNGLSVLSKDAHIFYYCDENHIWLIQQCFKNQEIKLKRVCLWIKNNQNPTNQTAFNKSYEPCVYGIIGKPYLAPINNLTEIINKEIGTGNDIVSDISNLWIEKRLPGNRYEHATEKPPTLHEKPFLRCSKPGDIILDLFGGSGSTLIACEKLNRKALLVEQDPVYCELIIRRYEKLTSMKAKLL